MLRRYWYEAGEFQPDKRLNNKRGYVFATDMNHAVKLVKRIHKTGICVWSLSRGKGC